VDNLISMIYWRTSHLLERVGDCLFNLIGWRALNLHSFMVRVSIIFWGLQILRNRT